jgi:hypothetical protein
MYQARQESEVNVYSQGLKFYAEKLRNNEPFAFVRYGNGEWDCILDLYYRTRSGSQKFTPDLRMAMIDSLTQPHSGDYYTALQSVSFLGRIGLLWQAEEWLANNKLEPLWHDGEVFTKASAKGQLYPLIAAMKQHQVVAVGPPWLAKLKFADKHIPVKSHDCWVQAGAIEKQLRTLKDVVISFSAGPAAKVLIHRLWPVLGKHSWLIDFGSVWDPYCNIHSRRYHKRITPVVQRRNLSGK